MSKMGISTIRSYRGAKLFEAIGLSRDLADTYFGGTTSNIGGIRLEEIAADAIAMHNDAFSHPTDSLLEHKGIYSFRKDGEKHAWNPDNHFHASTGYPLGELQEIQGIFPYGR